jgi:hypothetical protein
MVAQLLTKYDKSDILSQDLQKMISILSDNVFDDSTESRARSLFLVESGSDSDQDEQSAKQVRYALVQHHATPRECIEDQGRAVNNIMKCIDASLKRLIVFPRSDTIQFQSYIQKVQDSFALACLMRNIYYQDYTAIPKQLQQLKDRAKQYLTTTDMSKFKRKFQTESAIYNEMVQLFGRRQDIEQKKSELEICEILLSGVYSQHRELAKTLKQIFEAKQPHSLEELLTTLVENRIIEEGLGGISFSPKFSEKMKSEKWYPIHNFLQFSQDFSRENFFYSFHTNFLEKIFSRENSCQFLFWIPLDSSRLFQCTFLSTVPKLFEFRRRMA